MTTHHFDPDNTDAMLNSPLGDLVRCTIRKEYPAIEEGSYFNILKELLNGVPTAVANEKKRIYDSVRDLKCILDDLLPQLYNIRLDVKVESSNTTDDETGLITLRDIVTITCMNICIDDDNDEYVNHIIFREKFKDTESLPEIAEYINTIKRALNTFIVSVSDHVTFVGGLGKVATCKRCGSYGLESLTSCPMCEVPFE